MNRRLCRLLLNSWLFLLPIQSEGIDASPCSEFEVCLCCPEVMYVMDDLVQAIFSADCVVTRSYAHDAESRCTSERPKFISMQRNELEENIWSALEVQHAFMEDAHFTKPLQSVLHGDPDSIAKAGADMAEVNAELDASLGLLSNDHAGALWIAREFARRFQTILYEYFSCKHPDNSVEVLKEMQRFFDKDVTLFYPNGAFQPTLSNIRSVLYLDGNLRELLWFVSHAFPTSDKMTAIINDIMDMYGWSNEKGEFLDGQADITDCFKGSWLNISEVKSRHKALWRCHHGLEDCFKSYGHIGVSPGWASVLRPPDLERNVTHIRVRRGKFTKELVLGPLTNSALKIIGIPELTTRECEWLANNPKFEAASPCDNSSEIIQWPIGGKLWKLLDSEEARPGPTRRTFLSKLSSLKLPVSAGPSGTTDVYFHVAKMFSFGVAELELLRLAVAGFLVPYNFHSWAEIGIVSEPFGLTFRLIRPFDDVLPIRDSELIETSLVERDGVYSASYVKKTTSWPQGDKLTDLLLTKRQKIRSSMSSVQWFRYDIVRPVEHMALTIQHYPFEQAGHPLLTNEKLEQDFGLYGIHSSDYFPESLDALRAAICEGKDALVSVVLRRAVCAIVPTTTSPGHVVEVQVGVTAAVLLCILATIFGALIMYIFMRLLDGKIIRGDHIKSNIVELSTPIQ